MKYLLDTNVVSALRIRGRNRPVEVWAASVPVGAPFDLSAARILAAYRVPEHAPFDDAIIAAVAQSAEMIVATRNTKHFEPLGVPSLNPWDKNPTPQC